MKIVHHLYTLKISGSRANRAAWGFHLTQLLFKSHPRECPTGFQSSRSSRGRRAGNPDLLAEAFVPYRTGYSAEAFLDAVRTTQTLKQRMKHMTVLVAVSAK
jgi:hypothetical protein